METYKITVHDVYCQVCKRHSFKVLTETRPDAITKDNPAGYCATAFCEWKKCRAEQRPFIVLLLLTAIRNGKHKPEPEPKLLKLRK